MKALVICLLLALLLVGTVEAFDPSQSYDEMGNPVFIPNGPTLKEAPPVFVPDGPLPPKQDAPLEPFRGYSIPIPCWGRLTNTP